MFRVLLLVSLKPPPPPPTLLGPACPLLGRRRAGAGGARAEGAAAGPGRGADPLLLRPRELQEARPVGGLPEQSPVGEEGQGPAGGCGPRGEARPVGWVPSPHQRRGEPLQDELPHVRSPRRRRVCSAMIWQGGKIIGFFIHSTTTNQTNRAVVAATNVKPLFWDRRCGWAV